MAKKDIKNDLKLEAFPEEIILAIREFLSRKNFRQGKVDEEMIFI